VIGWDTRWDPDSRPDHVRVGPIGWVLAAIRAVALLVVLIAGLLILLALRLPERLWSGTRRPWTSRLTQGVCRLSLRTLGFRLTVRGAPLAGWGAVVANHSSWLDIFVLNACQPITFVSKSEVARWPFIGWLARATGTVFIERDPRKAAAQARLFVERIRQGDRLLFFPEGTSTDGMRVLPFKSTLFEAFFAEGLADVMAIQPVAVTYRAPKGTDPRFYGWWGDMSLAPHLLLTLAALRQGGAEVDLLPPIPVAAAGSRKALAAAAEAAVRGAHRQP
jgi:1-acyl-sn-glycerol-3-phosphate acyltransferase